jgi:hypothetical protein
VDRQAAEWELWIAGDRLSACNLPLHVTETAVPIAEREGAIAIRIRLVHHLPADGTCREESVPFALDLKIEERLRPGIDYQIAVNDYTFSLFIQPENAP